MIGVRLESAQSCWFVPNMSLDDTENEVAETSRKYRGRCSTSRVAAPCVSP